MNLKFNTGSYLKHLLNKKVRKFIPGTFENLVSRKTKILEIYTSKERIKGLYVSMTTFDPRLEIFEYAVLSVLGGSILPEKFLIYVPKGFRGSVKSNPSSFLNKELDKGLIEMIEMNIDLGCHSKYFYAFQEFGIIKDIVICDDDVVYYKDWLKDLVIASKEFPDYDVFSFKTVQVKIEDGVICSYDEWVHCSQYNKGEDKILYAEGVGGVFYRKNCLTREVLNKEMFLKLAPKADDVWLWFCSYLNKVKIKHIVPLKRNRLLYVIPNSQGTNLWFENTINKRNDMFVNNCHSYFLKEFDLDITKVGDN